jgi:uncharacterized RDD family membrane protein YckC
VAKALLADSAVPGQPLADLLRVDGRLYAWLATQALTADTNKPGERALSVEIYRAGGGEVPVARAQVFGAAIGVVGVDGLARVAVVTASAPSLPQRVRGTPLARGPVPDIARLKVMELSLASGEVLTDSSPAHSDAVISRRDMQVLWLVLLAIGAVTLVFVVRSDGPTEARLPEGASLATPTRRMVAGVIDLMAALVLVGVVLGQSPMSLVSGQGLASNGLGPVLGALVTACFHCTLGEALFGRSLGKFTLGIRVSAMRCEVEGVGTERSGPDGKQVSWVPGEPTLGQAVVRNLVRWCLPPIGVLMFLDGSFRHAGDLLARTLVVLPEEADGKGSGERSDE